MHFDKEPMLDLCRSCFCKLGLDVSERFPQPEYPSDVNCLSKE